MKLHCCRGLAYLILSFALTVGARAARFDFSYLFQEGQSVTGTFEGNIVGAYVEDVSNITMVVNGVAVNHEIMMLSQDGDTTELISFDVTLNRFYFRPIPDGTFYQFGFWHNDLWPQYVSLFTPDMFEVPGQAGFDASPGANSWSLIETTATVADSSSTSAMLALSIMALAFSRSRMSRAR